MCIEDAGEDGDEHEVRVPGGGHPREADGQGGHRGRLPPCGRVHEARGGVVREA